MNTQTGIRWLVALALVVVTSGAAKAAPASGVFELSASGSQDVGRFNGVEYTRTWGVVHGRVSPNEKVVGLAALPKDADGDYDYTAEFEIIAPSSGAPDTAIFVEAENRGSPIFLGALNHLVIGGKPSTAYYPAGVGNGFLFNHHIAYARVQWQTAIAAGVPDQAQGIGEVITRDFGRLLAGETMVAPPPDSVTSSGRALVGLGAYKTRVLGAISQSAWFVNTFIAEGFNADPRTGRPVFNGAIAIDGTGNWIAINQLGAQASFPQYPYVNEASHPLTPRQLLNDRKSDPFYVDVANLSDFYRVRASVSESAGFPVNMRRYDWPSPHAAGSSTSASAFSLAGCNGGTPVALDPIGYAPYARAAVLGLMRRLGASGVDGPGLPPTTLFALGPPPVDRLHFNPLAGEALRTPTMGATGQPVGGVRFPEVDEPVGQPLGNLPHVGLDNIRDACGNFLEWRPWTPDELKAAYGSEDAWLKRYARSLDRLIAKGYLLAADRAEMLSTAAALYRNPAGY